MAAKKPLKLFFSPFTKRVFASFSYRVIDDDKRLIEITGKKYDVTDQVEIMAQNLGYTKPCGTD